MEKSEKINELAGALVQAQAEIKHAPQLANNPFFNSKYADLPTVIDTAKPVLSKYGLVVVQTVGGLNGNIDVTSILMHTSGQWIQDTVCFKPQKPGIQDAGSVITYLRRYGYAAICGIASEEDDDGNKGQDREEHKQAKPQAKQEAKITDVEQARAATKAHLDSVLSKLPVGQPAKYIDDIAKAKSLEDMKAIYKDITEEAKGKSIPQLIGEIF